MEDGTQIDDDPKSEAGKMIYQHATRDRDHTIAAALDALIEEREARSPPDLAQIWHVAEFDALRQ
ncbi:hypothetical protein [Plantactinospora sp. BC1]|uniref:hypothetical protein n=1 Tax=Plantactinospora sp. BC1 TaxID=2108470 RepID=UPI001F4276AA|nr:hypothetical protein [Plantactinospora sp. BC1]